MIIFGMSLIITGCFGENEKSGEYVVPNDIVIETDNGGVNDNLTVKKYIARCFWQVENGTVKNFV